MQNGMFTDQHRRRAVAAPKTHLGRKKEDGSDAGYPKLAGRGGKIVPMVLKDINVGLALQRTFLSDEDYAAYLKAERERD